LVGDTHCHRDGFNGPEESSAGSAFGAFSDETGDQARRSGARFVAELPERPRDHGREASGARARGGGSAVAAGPPVKDAVTSAAGLMADCAESHIGRPDCLPDDPLFWIGGRDDVITAFVDGDMIDGAVRVRIYMEEHEVAAPCRASALAAEMLELFFSRPGDGLAVVTVYIPGESAAVEA